VLLFMLKLLAGLIKLLDIYLFSNNKLRMSLLYMDIVKLYSLILIRELTWRFVKEQLMRMLVTIINSNSQSVMLQPIASIFQTTSVMVPMLLLTANLLSKLKMMLMMVIILNWNSFLIYNLECRLLRYMLLKKLTLVNLLGNLVLMVKIYKIFLLIT
jgi:hypothetical protein